MIVLLHRMKLILILVVPSLHRQAYRVSKTSVIAATYHKKKQFARRGGRDWIHRTWITSPPRNQMKYCYLALDESDGNVCRYTSSRDVFPQEAVGSLHFASVFSLRLREFQDMHVITPGQRCIMPIRLHQEISGKPWELFLRYLAHP
jgi:hypothetical protein